VDGLTPATPQASATSGVSIPLDLVSPLLPYREQGGLSIRVERLPFNARLSKGRNNGDNTWSLTLDDLNDLLYLPPEGLDTPHTLTVRAISIEDDSASTLMRFDVPIGSGEIPDAAAPDTAAMQPGPADQAAPPIANAEAPSPPPPLAEISGDPGRRNDESTASATSHAFDAAEALDGHAAAPAPAPNTVTTASLPDSNAYTPPTQPPGTEAVITQEVAQRVAEARASWEPAIQLNVPGRKLPRAIKRHRQASKETARPGMRNAKRS